MTLGGLFSGIGGFELAAQWAGIDPVWSNEIDPFCCGSLRQNFTHDIIEADIRDIGRGRKHELSSVDIICGGFPCQPFSMAGKRGGQEDDRYLWPEMCRIIDEIRPRWVIGENVSGITSMEIETCTLEVEDAESYFLWTEKVLQRIINDLNAIGYDVPRTDQGEPIFFNIPACGTGALHRRERIWITAYPYENGNYQNDTAVRGKKEANERKTREQDRQRNRVGHECVDTIHMQEVNTYTEQSRLSQRDESRREAIISTQVGIPGFEREDWNTWDCPPELPMLAYGLSEKLDKPETEALGNAIVPQVAQAIFESILQVENSI